MSEFGLLVKNQYGNIHTNVLAEAPTIIAFGYGNIAASGSIYGNIGAPAKNAIGFYHADSYASPAMKWYGDGYVRIYQRFWKVSSKIYFIIGQYGPGQLVTTDAFGIRNNNIFQNKSITSDLPHFVIGTAVILTKTYETTEGPFDDFLWGDSAAFNYFYIPFVDINPAVFMDSIATVDEIERRIQVAHIWRNNATALDLGLYATIDKYWTLLGGTQDTLITLIKGISGIYGG